METVSSSSYKHDLTRRRRRPRSAGRISEAPFGDVNCPVTQRQVHLELTAPYCEPGALRAADRRRALAAGVEST